jgi:transposase
LGPHLSNKKQNKKSTDAKNILPTQIAQPTQFDHPIHPAMKTYQLKSNSTDILQNHPALRKRLEAALQACGEATLCLGLDLEKDGACVVAQLAAGAPLSLGTLPRPQIEALVAALVARGAKVAIGLEACGFGWRFQERLRAAGATVFTYAPEPLTGRRKTNRRDAAALAQVTYDRVVHGNARAGRVVREPSQIEQQRRQLTRRRGQLLSVRGKLEGAGRGLLLDCGVTDYPECWWGKKSWPGLAKKLQTRGEEWLLGQLARQRELTYGIHQEILRLDAEVKKLADELLPAQLPIGLGELTALTCFVEVMDWQRFHNRKQAGSYIGCCPSEHSTGAGQVLGSIDRQGNRRLRSLLTEAVHRLLRWEPAWRGFAKWGGLLRDKQAGGVRRKKAVIACVRLLFIDLWRLFSGRATMAELGFRGGPRRRATECEAGMEAAALA